MNKEQFLNKMPQEFSNEDFYLLCKAFIDVALNADKYKTPEGAVAGNFHLEDMNKASKLVKDYLAKYEINAESLKRAIKVHAHETIDDDDKRQKAFYDQNTNRVNAPAYQTGTLYIFTEVPNNVMEEIFRKALI